LLERPGKFVALGVSIDKIEELEIALGVADDAVEIVNLKKAEIAVVILDAFLLELGALFGSEGVILVPGLRTGGPKLMLSEKRFATVRAHAVRPAGQLHLQHSQIDPELQFLPAVQSKDLAHFDGAVLVRPILQNGVQIQAHPEQMIEHLVFNCQSWRVDAWDALSFAPEDRRRRTAVGGWRSEGRRTEDREQRSAVSGQRSDHRTFRKSSIVICACRRMLCNVFGAIEA